jgi:RNA polymerase sigma factor (TIGR02999 family)
VPKAAGWSTIAKNWSRGEFMESQDVTGLLVKWGQGEHGVLDQILPTVYDELHRIAGRYLNRERPNHTLQPTALINEAYLRLVDQSRLTLQNRAHFFGIAARVMRRILVEHARAHQAAKRGGSAIQVPLDEAVHGGAREENIDFVVLDAALDRLAKMDSQQSRVVELRYFAGLTIEETAEAMGASPATIKRSWTVARAWLRREMTRSNVST